MTMIVVLIKRRRGDKWWNRTHYVSPINQKREQLGEFNTLFQELKFDARKFFRYTRMNVERFHELLFILEPHLTKHHPRALSAELKLAMTLK